MDLKESNNDIEAAMAHLHPARLAGSIKKTKRLKFHLTDEEFDEIRETAESLDLSIAEYFCALHHYAAPRLQVSSQSSDWVLRSSHKKTGDREEH